MSGPDKISLAIKSLVDTIRAESAVDEVAINVFINAQECLVTKTIRTPEDLKSQGISMRNLRGEWVK